MPKKTKKNKIKAVHNNQEKHASVTEASKSQELDTKKIFLKDMRKSLSIIAVIIAIEVGLYVASSNNLIPFILPK